MLVAGGRYACGNPNSLMPVWSDEGHPPGPAQLHPDRGPDRVHPRPERPDLHDPRPGARRARRSTRSPARSRRSTAGSTRTTSRQPGATPYPGLLADEFAAAASAGCPSGSARRPRRARPGGRQTVPSVGLRDRVHARPTVTAPADVAVRHRLRQPGRRRSRTTSRSRTRRGRSYSRATSSTGVATREYQVPALDGRDLPILCTVHPNMTGTLTADDDRPPTRPVGG